MRSLHKIWKLDSGFSLTELMVVLVIIGVLVLLALPKLLPIVTRAKTTEAKLMLTSISTATAPSTSGPSTKPAPSKKSP